MRVSRHPGALLQSIFRSQLATWLALAAACAATWFAYAPGLHGGFLFDDFVNLTALGATGPVDNAATFWRYVTSGTADPTGRPLALLSFLLDARNWPADPAPFLRTNLCLHLLNGVLLFGLLRQLGRRLDGASSRTDLAAVLGAAAWLLHPLFVSTTLYIVQREAMLSTTCIVLGLIGYAHGRTVFDTAPRRGLAWMLASLAVGTVLATACKANGVLLPLLAWVLEATVFATRAAPSRALRHFRWLALVVPSIALALGLLVQGLQGAQIVDRDWTIAERLLTEPRVLLDYLQLLFVPRAMSTGLFNDGYPVSTGWMQPASTLPALLAIVALVTAGFLLRRRVPAVSAAILFFCAGHVLESTVLPLELYYEHRNYLPAMLAFWPLARALCAWRRPVWQRAAIAVGVLAVFGATTHERATLWGQPDALARAWALHNPQSPRAQAVAAMAELDAGRPDLAEHWLRPALAARPHDLQLVFNQVDARCALGGVDPALDTQVTLALRQSRGDQALAWRWLDATLDAHARQPCNGIDLDTLARWIDAAAANPQMRDAARRQDIAALRGKLALLRGDIALALRHFDAALDAWPTPTAAAKQASMLGARGHYAEALAHLDHYDALHDHRMRPRGMNMATLHALVLERQQYWPRELARLRGLLQSDLDAARKQDASQ